MNALVLTVSDSVSRGEAEDRSGPAAVDVLAGLGITADLGLVEDGVESVRTALLAAVEVGRPLVITTGGTGLAARDLTPEA
ncbi:MAG: MogA/MoaB family molybdenum cofactor biosynthesis protein, partial [Acidimicrobiia bacterium]|nr:MogA/MoaB family molybdenum cofactor biosynthesis protein [Acidimicrobiia bacterium]